MGTLIDIVVIVVGVGPFVLALIAGRRNGPGWLRVRVGAYSLLALYMTALGISSLTDPPSGQPMRITSFFFLFAVVAVVAAFRSFRALRAFASVAPTSSSGANAAS